MKTYGLEELTDKYAGKKGTKERNDFETALRSDILGQAKKQVRLARNLTQEQVVGLTGVKKVRISKIESSSE